jgi:hypothetical protein
MCGGCVRRRPEWPREVSGVWRCCRAPLSRPALAAAPVWEEFPEVNRVLVARLLGVLMVRMAQAVVSGGDGGECGECHGEAALGAG